jgi:hypothetical protein
MGCWSIPSRFGSRCAGRWWPRTAVTGPRTHSNGTIASLAEQDFVGPPQGSTGYEAVDRALAGTGNERRVIFEAVDVLTILDFVAHGLGFTLLPEYLATSRPDLRAIPLADPDMTWTLAAIMSRHQATPAGRAFAALLPQPGPPQQPCPSPQLPAGSVMAQGHRGGPETYNAQLCATSSTEPEDRRTPAATDGGAPTSMDPAIRDDAENLGDYVG